MVFGAIKHITFVFRNNIALGLDLVFCEYVYQRLPSPSVAPSLLLLISGVLFDY